MIDRCCICGADVSDLGIQVCKKCILDLTNQKPRIRADYIEAPKKTCSFPDGIEDIKPDGVHSLDPCLYEDVEIHTNCTVIVSKCKRCDKMDFSWERTELTEDIIL